MSSTSVIFASLDSDAPGENPVHSPIDGALIGQVAYDTSTSMEAKASAAYNAFLMWRDIPAPRRGELVRLFGNELREAKPELARLVSLETGKILQEGMGEVQEMIDICDFAVGLSRQLYGLTIASERPKHRMMETWHPLGPVAIISAFNFPVAVWAWNAALALVCGNSVVWKPSEKTPLTALATQRLMGRAMAKMPEAPDGLCSVILGGADVGHALVRDRRMTLVSATGSTRMGQGVGPVVAERFGRCLLELGGNNCMIVMPSADLELTVRAILFSAVGTAGQRCTSLRRLLIHSDIYDSLISKVRAAYSRINIGDPMKPGTLVGPLIDDGAFAAMNAALAAARVEGGIVFGGERVLIDEFPKARYVRPALVELATQTGPMLNETFAPILYAVKVGSLDEAIRLQNEVPQGLSSCIFTNDVREAEIFVSSSGSDCGIANVNIGPSGAEIGGAFGGEKETGGGRESGSDSWRAYMRRQTVTINYSADLPLAQGITFEA